MLLSTIQGFWDFCSSFETIAVADRNCDAVVQEDVALETAVTGLDGSQRRFL